MTMFQPVGASADRVMAALSAGLALEFGANVGAALARRFLDAEEVDFRWEARSEERWLGAYEGDGEVELDRVAIIGRLDGEWFVATCIVDGDGMPHGMTGCRTFRRRAHAAHAFAQAH